MTIRISKYFEYLQQFVGNCSPCNISRSFSMFVLINFRHATKKITNWVGDSCFVFYKWINWLLEQNRIIIALATYKPAMLFDQSLKCYKSFLNNPRQSVNRARIDNLINGLNIKQ